MENDNKPLNTVQMSHFWSQLRRKEILIDGKGATSFGKLNAVFMNPDAGEVIAYMIGMGKVLSPVDIQEMTKEHVIVRSLDSFVSPHELVRLEEYGFKRCLLNFKRVRSKSGKNFGRVQDFQMDKLQMRVDKIIVAKSFLGFQWDERIFSWHNIHNVTETAIILKHEPESTKKIKIHAAAPHPS